MKRHFTIILVMILLSKVSGQGLLLDLRYSSSSLAEFKKYIGLDIGYSKLTKSGNKIGIYLNNSFNPFEYDDIHITDADPGTYLIREANPESYILSLQAGYSFLLFTNSNAHIFFGPVAGLNYFRINESVHRFPSGNFTDERYKSNSQVNNRLSIGFLFEYQVNDVLFKNLDLLYSIGPMAGAYEKFAAMGSPDPWFYLSIDFKIGVCYKFGKSE